LLYVAVEVVMMTTALLLLGGVASLLASLYEGSSAVAQAGDVVLALGATASLALSRKAARH
jgi:hypothetical protein